MAYFPKSDGYDAKSILDSLSVSSVDDLFASIPESLRSQAKIDLPEGLDEFALTTHFRQMSQKNKSVLEIDSFVGAGAYPYPLVSAAQYAMSRGEFLTAYTPYQPEISQGTLQVIFEFQTWISELSGMEIANASMYDGATALAEAILMGLRVRRKCRHVYLSAGIGPAVRSVVDRYLAGQDIAVETLPLNPDGQTDLSGLMEHEGGRILAIATPNTYGIIEDQAAVAGVRVEKDFLITYTPDPHAWLIVAPPGDWNADVAVAEGQALGVPVGFGGPLLGLFATRQEYLRQLPGRICGQTEDLDGRPGYVLTMSTREQHIRREKATSNICSNQGIIALLSTVTMGVLGPEGLRDRALKSVQNARKLEQVLLGQGFERVHAGPYFHEFVVQHPMADALWQKLVDENIQLGFPLRKWDGALENQLLVCSTAINQDEQFERLDTCLKQLIPQ